MDQNQIGSSEKGGLLIKEGFNGMIKSAVIARLILRGAM